MSMIEPTFEELQDITGEQVIACLKRELALRKQFYPKWIANGKMTQEKAAHEIAAMAVAIEFFVVAHPVIQRNG